jgi:hypothetical protein
MSSFLVGPLPSVAMKYDPSLLTVLDFLMQNLIASVNRDFVCARSGDRLSFADAAFLLYSLLDKLILEFLQPGQASRGTNVDKLYFDLLQILSLHAPSTRKLLDVFAVQRFAFLKSSLNTFLTQDIPKEEDAALMFTAIISAQNPAKFLTCLVAASLVHLHPRLEETPECDADQFSARYIACLPSLDVPLWLCNTEKLLEVTRVDPEPQD